MDRKITRRTNQSQDISPAYSQWLATFTQWNGRSFIWWALLWSKSQKGWRETQTNIKQTLLARSRLCSVCQSRSLSPSALSPSRLSGLKKIQVTFTLPLPDKCYKTLNCLIKRYASRKMHFTWSLCHHFCLLCKSLFVSWLHVWQKYPVFTCHIRLYKLGNIWWFDPLFVFLDLIWKCQSTWTWCGTLWRESYPGITTSGQLQNSNNTANENEQI